MPRRSPTQRVTLALTSLVLLAGSWLVFWVSSEEPAPTPGGSTLGPPREPTPDGAVDPSENVTTAPEPRDTSSNSTSACDETRTIFGTVRAQSGSPIARARVEALRLPEEEYGLSRSDVSGLERYETVSNADGSYCLEVPGSHDFDLVVSHPDHESALARETAGTQRDFVLASPRRLVVRVRTPAGDPASAARVRVTHDESPLAPLERLAEENGDATFVGLPAGTLEVLASSPEYPRAATEIRLRAGSNRDTEVELRFAEGGVLRGVVLDAGSGEPIEGATVETGFDVRRETRTDADGSFVLGGIPIGGGDHEVRAHARGYATAPRRVGFDEGEPGERFEEFRLSRGRKVTGLVTAGGQPIAEARITAHGYYKAGSTISRDLRVAKSSEDGSFEVAGLRRDARHSILVHHAAHAPRIVEVEPGEDVDVFLGEIALSRPVLFHGTVVDEAGRGIEGCEVAVSRSPDLVKSAGRAVRIDFTLSRLGSPLLARKVITGPGGGFEIPRLAAGDYQLRASADRYVPFAEPLRLLGDQERTIELIAGGGVEGTVASETGETIARASVALTQLGDAELDRDARSVGGTGSAPDSGAPRKARGETDEYSRFRVTGLAPGRWLVRVSAPGFAALESTAVVERERVTPLGELRLRSRRSVAVDEAARVVDGLGWDQDLTGILADIFASSSPGTKRDAKLEEALGRDRLDAYRNWVFDATRAGEAASVKARVEESLASLSLVDPARVEALRESLHGASRSVFDIWYGGGLSDFRDTTQWKTKQSEQQRIGDTLRTRLELDLGADAGARLYEGWKRSQRFPFLR